jgi:translocation and assembly module TamB
MARTRRWPRIAGKTAAWFFGVLAALVLTALLCINTPIARRIIAEQVNTALAGVVNGRIVIDHIGAIGFTRASGVRARLTDQSGRTLLSASGVSARVRTWTLVKSLLGKSGPDVHLDSVSMAHLDALLDADHDGDLLVQKALASPPPPPNPPPAKPSTLKLAIDDGRLGSAWLHGHPSEGFLLDADLRDMRLGVTLANAKTTLDLRRLGVVTRGMPDGANVEGNLTGHVVLPPAPQKLAAKGRFDGTVAEVATKVDGSLKDDVVEAHLAADASPNSLKRLVPSVALKNPARLRVDARGTLPDVQATGSVVTGPARATFTANVVVTKPLRGRLELDASNVDLASVANGAPRSDLNAHLRANATVPGGGTPSGSFTLETKPARLAAQRVPAMTVEGKLNGYRGNMRLAVAEPGTMTRVTADLDLRKMEAGYDASISIPDFTKFERVPSSTTGSASVRVRGTAYLNSSTVSGDVRARLSNLRNEDVRVRVADVGAAVSGPLSNPDVHAKVISDGVLVAGRSFDAVALTVRGNRSGASVGAALEGASGTPDATVSTRVKVGDRITLTATEAKIGRGDDRVRARVDTLRFGGGVVQAEGITIDGAGATLSAAARISQGSTNVRAVSAGIDVGKVARALGVAKGDVRGKLALDVDLKTRGRTARGKVGLELSDGAYGGVDGLNLRLASTVDGKRFSGLINARLDGARVDVDAQNVTLDGSPWSPRAWTHASGRVLIDSELDFARLSKVLPTTMLPFDDMSGRIVLAGELSRDAKDTAPETRWQLRTDGFRASAKTSGERPHAGIKVRAPPPWHVAGVDVDGTISISKERGHTALNAQFRDAVGPLAELDATADLPYRDVVESGIVSAKSLEATPFQVRLAVPRRRLSKLPPLFATAGIDGDIELTLEARDTAREPVVKVDALLHQLQTRGRRKATPVDVHIDARYGEGLGKVSLDVDTKAKRALSVDSEVHAKVSDLLDGTRGEWDASVKGKIDTFPLDALTLAGSQRIKGTLSGAFDAATGTRVAPHAWAKLNAEGVTIGRDQRGARATLDANADDHGMDAKVRFDQADGFAEVSASAGLTWSGPLSPTVDPSKGAARAAATANHFRLAVLEPLVQGTLSDLDGRVDANAHFEAAAAHGAPKIDGQIVLDEATFEVTAAAQEFHGVHADVVLREDGTLRVDNVVARGLSGTLNASGEATFDGLKLKRAKLSAKVPSSDPLPVSLQGQSFAKASGNIEVQAVPAPEKQEMDITVDVPSAKVTLFDRSSHALQPLDRAEHIRIGYHRTSEEFVVVPLERPARVSNTEEPPTTVVASVNLHDVEVVRGTDLRARLEGNPKIRLAQETSINGEIHLRSGYMYVQGKKFEIENGTVTFIGEPDNPNVVLTAGWTAPEGTRVLADFVGPLKSGKVTLRSDPPHSKNEILSLILFGTTDGMGATSSTSSSTASTAAGVAGGVATQGLNKAIDDMTGLDITTRIDTSESSNPRPEIEMRVARDVTVAVSHVIGVPAPGTNPDLNYATVNWRFLRNWSLDATIGDLGSSILDLVWTHRY